MPKAIPSVWCPSCRGQIPLADVNVAADLAICRQCDREFSYVELRSKSSQIDQVFDISSPPAGAWYRDDFDGVRLGATTRSWGALFLVPFTLVWSGFSLGGIYGSQIISGKFEWFLSLFGLPFLIGSIFLIGMTLMTLVGKVAVRVDRHGSTVVFTGVGPIGRRQRFNLNEMQINESAVGNNDQSTAIVVQGPTRHSFGSMLSEQRLYFLLAALRKIQQDQKPPPHRGMF